MTREQEYTAIIRKSKVEYVAICLESSASASGVVIIPFMPGLSKAKDFQLR